MRRSLTMNKFVKSMMLTVVSLMTVAFFSACDKDMVDEPLQVQETKAVMNDRENLSLLAASKPIDQYSEEEIVKEVFPILQKFIDAQFAYAIGKDKMPQWNQYLLTPDDELQNRIDQAVCLDGESSKILSYSGYLKKSDTGYTKIYFMDNRWYFDGVVEKSQLQLSNGIESEGGWNYSFIVSQDTNHNWKIESWKDDENITQHSIWYRDESGYLQGHIKECIRAFGVRAGYSGQAAANYAREHWNDPNPNWCDYTYNGGDCTNFVSQCLLAGGWTQKTGSGYCQDDAWFHKGVGHCWNTSTVRNYSCSWTQAKDLYRYLSYVSNATLVWMGNQTPYARIGDIIQIKGSNSEMVHSTIVTKIAGGHIYVTYRNAYNYDPAKDVAIDLFGYENCYYWSINGRN